MLTLHNVDFGYDRECSKLLFYSLMMTHVCFISLLCTEFTLTNNLLIFYHNELIIIMIFRWQCFVNFSCYIDVFQEWELSLMLYISSFHGRPATALEIIKNIFDKRGRVTHQCVVKDLLITSMSRCYRGKVSSKYFSNSVVNASELLSNLEERFLSTDSGLWIRNKRLQGKCLENSPPLKITRI